MIRDDFPEAGSDYQGGTSDGWEYRTTFFGANLDASLAMVRQFLIEEGYAALPLPACADDLLLFRQPTRRSQTLLFGDNGFVHYPIKVLFADEARNRRKLTLCIYNEHLPDALLRFHQVLELRKKRRAQPTSISKNRRKRGIHNGVEVQGALLIVDEPDLQDRQV